METTLDVLRARLIEGVEITEAKEKRTYYEVTLSKNGVDYKTRLPVSCSPGQTNAIADHTVYSALAHFALARQDLEQCKYWIQKTTE